MDDMILSKYYKELSNVVVLSREAELEAFHSYRKGDKDAGRRLVESCLKLVFSIARSYWKDQSAETLKDLISAGNEGLMRSLGKFDPTRGVKFSTYTGYWVLMYIRRYAVEDSKIVKPPIAQRRKAKLEKELRNTGTYVYLDLQEFNQVSESLNPQEEVEAVDGECHTKHLVLTCNRFLSNRERIIVENTFGLNGGGEDSLKKLGSRLGLSSERIRQIKTSALEKIQSWCPYFL